ncbi:NUDIX domain-containing protein [Candidatus Woesearchaeota archaeon]|nr:NUDIX domain-containing protein [Candidatus Woesearchaeota archaeon]
MIVKAGLAAIRSGKLLLVKKKGLRQLIMPGGKVMAGESFRQALQRELQEELGTKAGNLRLLGKFVDVAAGQKGSLQIVLFSGALSGRPRPGSEIKKIVWVGSGSARVSPIVKNKILPFLKRKALL